MATTIPDPVRELRGTGPLAHVVTLDPDGTPHVTLAWAGFDGDEVVMATFFDLDQTKPRNLRRAPRVTLSFEARERTGEPLHPYVVIQGRARITEGGALAVMDRLAELYLAPARCTPCATFRPACIASKGGRESMARVPTVRPAAGGPPIGAELPEGVRFIGPVPGLEPSWRFPEDAPTDADLATCVNCGLCLPHCPTYRLTGEESASPRGRINAMRAVAEGRAQVDRTFASFMDLCLACRACEDVCPSHAPFGRMMERARVQIEPLRTRRARLVRWLGLDVVLPRRKLLWLAAALQQIARPFLGRRVRRLVPRRSELFRRLPRVTEPEGEARGTVAVLSGCVQDRWFRPANRATIRVLARNGWRVVVPRTQVCCGALAAHNGRLSAARRMARRNVRAFADAEVVVVNAAGCGAHLKEVGELLGTEEAGALGSRVRDLMELLHEQGIRPPSANAGVGRVAYHDACHALRAQKIRSQPRAVLRAIPGLEVVEIPDGERCCGAAGLYNVTQPETAGELMRRKADGVASTGAAVVASANPGCMIQLAAGLRERGADVEVVHPVELLDRAYSAEADATEESAAEADATGG